MGDCVSNRDQCGALPPGAGSGGRERRRSGCRLLSGSSGRGGDRRSMPAWRSRAAASSWTGGPGRRRAALPTRGRARERARRPLVAGAARAEAGGQRVQQARAWSTGTSGCLQSHWCQRPASSAPGRRAAAGRAGLVIELRRRPARAGQPRGPGCPTGRSARRGTSPRHGSAAAVRDRQVSTSGQHLGERARAEARHERARPATAGPGPAGSTAADLAHGPGWLPPRKASVAQEAMPDRDAQFGLVPILAALRGTAPAGGAYRTGTASFARPLRPTAISRRGQRGEHARQCQRAPRRGRTPGAPAGTRAAPRRPRSRRRRSTRDTQSSTWAASRTAGLLADDDPVERDGGEREAVAALQPVPDELVDPPGHAEGAGRRVEVGGAPGRAAAPGRAGLGEQLPDLGQRELLRPRPAPTPRRVTPLLPRRWPTRPARRSR